MPTPDRAISLEEQVGLWRSYLQRRQAIHPVDVAELEDHLREQVTTLTEAGLAEDEAFLIAVKRMGDLDALSREFAREHSDRLWKQLVVVQPVGPGGTPGSRREAIGALAFAAGAGLGVKALGAFGGAADLDDAFFAKNVPLVVLPFVAGYFAWKRRLDARVVGWLALAFVVAAIVVNAYPFAARSNTEMLAALHLPIALWLTVGIAYAAGRWHDSAGRMDFVRFSGELFIYFVLIALGGGVLMAFTAMLFKAIGMDIEPVFERWLLPFAVPGALVVAAWLVEAKQSVIENMAPVLTRLFTPMFAALLLVFLGTMLWTGRALDVQRDLLIAFDGLLAVVLALLLYSISARDAEAPPGAFDVVQLVLVVSALLADAVALWVIATRISAFGFTPNRVAALGENVILLVNLAWSAVLCLRFLRGRGSFRALERWQTRYLHV
ncbi:MAG TPA: permease prefix domain 1-containing protein, partial [Gemmatimonadaceae bacterium]